MSSISESESKHTNQESVMTTMRRVAKGFLMSNQIWRSDHTSVAPTLFCILFQVFPNLK